MNSEQTDGAGGSGRPPLRDSVAEVVELMEVANATVRDPSGSPVVPDWFQRALEPTGVPRRTWRHGLAPAYIGLFLWIVYFDQIPREVLGRGGLLTAVIGCGIGAGLCHLLLYLAPAMLGVSTGRSLMVVSTSTFGLEGAAWVPGLVLSLAQVLTIAVSVGYGTSLCFWGLDLLGLLDLSWVGPAPPARGFWTNPVFLVTAAAWGLATTMVGGHLVRVIVALMLVYPFVPAAILAASSIAAFRGLPRFDPAMITPSTDLGSGPPEAVAVATAVQLLFGFFAPTALASVDWGAATTEPAEVRKGGVVSVSLAAWIVATLAILTVAGSVGAGLVSRPRFEPGGVFDSTYQQSLIVLLGAKVAGALFQLLALTALAPACYAGHFLFQWLHDWRPWLSRNGWTLLGLAVALILIASGWAFRLAEVFGVLGALCAPAVGGMTAEYLRARGRWRGVREGYHWPGMIAWSSGFVVGMVPTVARALGMTGPILWHPWALHGYLVAFFVYLLLTPLGLGSRFVELRDDGAADSST
ncbi:MAG: hypothetical protein AB7I30_14820 [Isosphaeraceae bacterium]